MTRKQTFTIKTLTKRSIWDVQENDIFRLWKEAERDADLKDNKQHYLDIVATAFEIEEITIDKPEVIKKYRDRGFKVGMLKGVGREESKWGVKKRTIARVADLTYDNIHNISAAQLLAILEGNFGGGWQSLTAQAQSIIESHFDISTTTLPKDRLHNPGGLYDKKVADNYEVLEIPKGTWVEVIFAKEKPAIDLSAIDESALAADDPLLDDPALDGFTDTETFQEEGDMPMMEEFNGDLKDEEGFADGIYDDDAYEGEYGVDNTELTLDDVVAAEDV